MACISTRCRAVRLRLDSWMGPTLQLLSLCLISWIVVVDNSHGRLSGLIYYEFVGGTLLYNVRLPMKLVLVTLLLFWALTKTE